MARVLLQASKCNSLDPDQQNIWDRQGVKLCTLGLWVADFQIQINEVWTHVGKAVDCYSLYAAKVEGASEVIDTCQATWPATVPLTMLALARWLEVSILGTSVGAFQLSPAHINMPTICTNKPGSLLNHWESSWTRPDFASHLCLGINDADIYKFGSEK